MAQITLLNPAGHSAEYLNFAAVCEQMQLAWGIVPDAERLARVRSAYLEYAAAAEAAPGYRPNNLGPAGYTAPCRLCGRRSTVSLSEFLADVAGIGYYHGHCIESQQRRLEAERYEEGYLEY